MSKKRPRIILPHAKSHVKLVAIADSYDVGIACSTDLKFIVDCRMGSIEFDMGLGAIVNYDIRVFLVFINDQ
jgi:hypothetical protein